MTLDELCEKAETNSAYQGKLDAIHDGAINILRSEGKPLTSYNVIKLKEILCGQ